MSKIKSINLGFRGWMLVFYQASAFLAFTAFTSFPINILADMYGGAQIVSMLYTCGTLVGIALQLIMSRYVGKVKSIKAMSIVLGIVLLLFALAVMLIPPSNAQIWYVCYFIVSFVAPMYAFFSVGILVGQWFPRRKGTVMGIATMAFPITNGCVGIFAARVFAKGAPDIFGAFLPFYIVCVAGLAIGIVFLKDYPEQVGAFRDNDASFTSEQAKAIMLEEIENKRTSVWTLGHTLASRDFWFSTIPIGTLLLCSVGLVTQTQSIISVFPELPFSAIMAVYMFVGCFGSWLMGVLDTKFGTKKAITLSVIIMIISGVAGSFRNAGALVAGLMFLGIFQGAASNFTVSCAAQYWRREDFPSVFSVNNPIATVLQCAGPSIIAMILAGNATANYTKIFIFTAILGVISLILILLFSPANVKRTDDKYREKAGKPLDNELSSRL